MIHSREKMDAPIIQKVHKVCDEETTLGFN